MNLIRIRPGRELLDVHDEVNRLLPFTPSLDSTAFLPPVDIEETESGYTLKMDVPGIKPEDLKVRVVDAVLTIEGERSLERPADPKGRTHRAERPGGSFSRSFTLRAPVNAAAIQASAKDGVLEVTLPRAAEAMPREIKVEVA